MLKFYCIFFFLTTCNSNQYGIDSSLKREWMLIQFKNYSKEYFTKKKASITLNENKTCSVSMGCNNASYQVQVKANSQIEFSSGTMTEMDCEEMKLETEVNALLPKIKNYKVQGHFLILYSDSGDSLKFVASDWD